MPTTTTTDTEFLMILAFFGLYIDGLIIRNGGGSKIGGGL
jgi:hypothetical protein